MKHTWSMTMVLIGLFVISQLLGVFIISSYVDPVKSLESGLTEFRELPTVGGVSLDRPDLEEETSWVYIIAAVFIGTMLLLVIIHFGGMRVWKAWFFMAILMALFIAFGAFVDSRLALGIAVIVALLKVITPRNLLHLVVQNGAELFIYGGLAAIFVPVLSITSAIFLLIAIAVYDAYAVWQSKHMVKMAKFQMGSGVFAGLSVPYALPGKNAFSKKSKAKSSSKKSSTKKSSRTKSSKKSRGIPTAILGGGDLAIPLLFTGAVFKSMGMGPALMIIPFTTASLFTLFYLADSDKFYPAMPFISSGALIGYLFVLLLHL
jgi:presenilin-like A22 family membrane protease